MGKTQKLLWHYTYNAPDLRTFDRIMESGFVLPIEYGPRTADELPVAWFSTNQYWEKTVRKGALVRGESYGMAQMLDRGYELYRIGVEPNTAPLNFHQIVKQAYIHPSIAKALKVQGKKWGAKPSEWRGSLVAVTKEKWVMVEKYECGNGWQPWQTLFKMEIELPAPAPAIGNRRISDDRRDVLVELLPTLTAEAVKQHVGDLRYCLGAAFALRTSFQHFGIEAELVPVTAMVVRRHESLPGGGYMLTVGDHPGAPETAGTTIQPKPLGPGLVGVDIHVVVTVGDDFIDPTAGQFSRPQYGIEIPESFVWRGVASHLDAGLNFSFGDDTLVQYIRFGDEAAWQDTIDRMDWTRSKRIADDVIRRAEQVLYQDDVVNSRPSNTMHT